MAAWPAIAATADGKTSIRPHRRDWTRVVVVLVVLEATGRPMVQFTSADSPSRRHPLSSDSNRKVPHGQALRDLRQGAAIRTPRQSRQEPGQPEVHAQPADGRRDGIRPDEAGAGVHPLPEDLLVLA